MPGHLAMQQFAYQSDQFVKIIFISFVRTLQSLDVSRPIGLGSEYFGENSFARQESSGFHAQNKIANGSCRTPISVYKGVDMINAP